MAETLNILISGGGTGGHIFPAISIANEIMRRRPDANILFVGAEGRMEAEKVPAAGYKIQLLPVSGFDRKHLLRNVRVVYRLMKSMIKARRIINKFKPHAAVGVGGYASGPMLKAAQKRGIPTLIQEQNGYPGVTNRILAKKASKICVAYENTERFFPADKIVLTGNPVRQSLLECTLSPEQARERLGIDPQRKTILVVGGSLGARTINQSIIAGLHIIADADVQVIWQSGKVYDAECRAALAESNAKNVRQSAFIAEMDVAYRAADLLVSSAGASSISELQLLGKASILVPSPNVSEDHQRKNAAALVDKGAAVMILDADAQQKLVTEMLRLANDNSQLSSLSQNIEKMALRNAAQRIVDELFELIPKN